MLFGALAVAWTWPLALHLGDALPGAPGDNYSFVWNLWWMRRVLATPGLGYFHTNYLFYPFGTTIADHPHTALPALVAATVLRRATVVTAQNLLLVGYVAANMTAMYALAWRMTGHWRAAILAAVTFGLSPYVAVHLLGHFDLVAVWPLPLYALALDAAIRNSAGRVPRSAILPGAILAATAYIAYYYVVYLCFFTIVYVAASIDLVTVERTATAPSRRSRMLAAACALAAAVFAAAALAIALSGGRTFAVAGAQVSARTPQNALTAMWTALAVAALAVWRPRVRVAARSTRGRRAAAIVVLVAITFAVLTAPLLWQAARLVLGGKYVTPDYGWRSIPHGVDLLALFAGHPLHPLFGPASARAYAAIGQNYVEVIGWFGIVPLVLLATTFVPDRLARRWRVVAVAFALWALGPFLTVGGVDTGLKLPAILLRYVPFVANARMPGRAIVVVFLAVAVLIAIGLARARGPLRSVAVQWALIVVVLFEYWDAPIRLTPLDRPSVYAALAGAAPGAVCEVPLGLGDGLSSGVGSQDRRVLFYATQHEHPLVGGYIGRMPAAAAESYRRMPIAGALLALSDGASPAAAPDVDVAASPCRYLVVRRSASSPALLHYVASLPADRLASDPDHDRELYRLRQP